MSEIRRAPIGMSAIVVAMLAAGLLPLSAMPDGARGIPNGALNRTVAVKVNSPWQAAPILVDRDPFVPKAKYALPSAQLHDGGISDATAITVKGIALGRAPQALIETGGKTRIIGPGDRIGRTRVRTILFDRIVLSNGLVLILSL